MSEKAAMQWARTIDGNYIIGCNLRRREYDGRWAGDAFTVVLTWPILVANFPDVENDTGPYPLVPMGD